MIKNTRLSLVYSDADDCRMHMTVVLGGAITQTQVGLLKRLMMDGYHVIASQVGLPTPAEKAIPAYGFNIDEDHVYTIIADYENRTPKADSLHTNDRPTVDLSINQLLKNLQSVRWSESDEYRRMMGMASTNILQPVKFERRSLNVRDSAKSKPMDLEM